MKHEILSWAFGFLTPLVIVAIVVAAGTIIIGGWFSLPENFKWLNQSQAWAGVWVFGAICIIGGVIVWRIWN